MAHFRNRGATGIPVTKEYIQNVKDNYPKEFPTPKYLIFCERAIDAGFTVHLYKPISGGVSKYVTVSRKSKWYKVRFSNHKPIKYKESQGDCDFFVGVTNFQVTTMEMAWTATLEYFSKGHKDGSQST